MLFCLKPNYDHNPLQAPMPPNFAALDYAIEHQQQQQFMKSHIDESEDPHNNDGLMVNYLMNNPHQHQHQHGQQQQQPQLSFADVMQFADFGPKLALNQTKIPEEDDDDQSGMDPVYFLKFPVLNDRNMEDHHYQSLHEDHVVCTHDEERFKSMNVAKDKAIVSEDQDHDSVQLQFLGEDLQKNPTTSEPNKNKRKRPRTSKTTEEVESQRMTHIAVERNRRKQMNEHLRVLRSLMPGSYVQRVRNTNINCYRLFLISVVFSRY